MCFRLRRLPLFDPEAILSLQVEDLEGCTIMVHGSRTVKGTILETECVSFA
jgi:hypothetical protein